MFSWLQPRRRRNRRDRRRAGKRLAQPDLRTEALPREIHPRTKFAATNFRAAGAGSREFSARDLATISTRQENVGGDKCRRCVRAIPAAGANRRSRRASSARRFRRARKEKHFPRRWFSGSARRNGLCRRDGVGHFHHRRKSISLRRAIRRDFVPRARARRDANQRRWTVENSPIINLRR